MRKNMWVYTRLVLSMLLPLVGYFVLRGTELDKSIKAPQEHFYIVSLVAMISLVLAIAVGFVAITLRNIKISFLSLSYVSLSGLFVLHGLSTPGFLSHHSSTAGSTAQLSVILAVVWLYLSSISIDQPLIKWFAQWQRWLLPLWIFLLTALCTILWFYPGLILFLHFKDLPMKWIASIFTIGLNGWTIYRYFQAYISSRFPFQLAIVYSSGWMIISQLIIVTEASNRK